MQLLNHKNAISLILIYLFSLLIILQSSTAQGKNKNMAFQSLNVTTNSSNYSPWLRRINNNRGGGRFMGCRRRPWICDQADPDFPGVRRFCCRNRCVDLTSDDNNCGLCGVRCLFRRRCCGGICVNLLRNPFHCGRCGHRCRFPSHCIYGLCGYAQPSPPFPFPFPPRPSSPPPGRQCPQRGRCRSPPEPVG